MSKQQSSDQHYYQITLQGHLGDRWNDWFDSLSIYHNDTTTILIGQVADQAALRGLINQIWDLGNRQQIFKIKIILDVVDSSRNSQKLLLFFIRKVFVNYLNLTLIAVKRLKPANC